MGPYVTNSPINNGFMDKLVHFILEHNTQQQKAQKPYNKRFACNILSTDKNSIENKKFTVYLYWFKTILGRVLCQQVTLMPVILNFTLQKLLLHCYRLMEVVLIWKKLSSTNRINVPLRDSFHINFIPVYVVNNYIYYIETMHKIFYNLMPWTHNCATTNPQVKEKV